MLEMKFTLRKADFLMYQLFTVSQSPQMTKRRKSVKMKVPAIYFCLGLILLGLQEIPMGVGFIILSIIWAIFYPSYQQRTYRKQLAQYVDEYYKTRFGEEMKIKFDEDFIHIKNDYSETKIILTHIEAMDEIKDYFFIKLKSGTTLIIPKKLLEDFETIKAKILALTAHLKVNLKVDLDWEWK